MKIKTVNQNISIFLIRYLLLIIFCFFTIFVTGRIADMNVLLGIEKYYDATGLSTQVAKNTFFLIRNWGNTYLIILFLGIILSSLIYILLGKYIDNKNRNIWISFLLSPGLLIYTNSPTKETLFFYPTLVFIILECNYINSKKRINILNFVFKFFILLIMFITRGDQSYPYIILSLLSIFLKNFKTGRISEKLKIYPLIIKTFMISIFINLILINLFPDSITRVIEFISQGLSIQDNIYRPNEFDIISNPLNILQVQFLSLFPTAGELLAKPYKVLIIIDSLLLIYSFVRAWESLFRLVNQYNFLKKKILILFSFIILIYFSVYGIIGSFNLGSSQRFRINYVPLGIVFPLILEKKFRERERVTSLKN